MDQSMEEFLHANNIYFKFMFVRHPMSRILSCYLDKMINDISDAELPQITIAIKKQANQIIPHRKHSKSIGKGIARKISSQNDKNGSLLVPNFKEFILETVLALALKGIIIRHLLLISDLWSSLGSLSPCLHTLQCKLYRKKTVIIYS